jgi:hypothetical protein
MPPPRRRRRARRGLRWTTMRSSVLVEDTPSTSVPPLGKERSRAAREERKNQPYPCPTSRFRLAEPACTGRNSSQPRAGAGFVPGNCTSSGNRDMQTSSPRQPPAWPHVEPANRHVDVLGLDLEGATAPLDRQASAKRRAPRFFPGGVRRRTGMSRGWRDLRVSSMQPGVRSATAARQRARRWSARRRSPSSWSNAFGQRSGGEVAS